MSSYILKSIHMTLDEKSIEQAIREIELFESQLQPAMECLVRYLAEKGVEIARAELVFFDRPAYDTGALSESIKSEVDGGKAHVQAGEGLTNAMGEPTNYAVYVEYGTGIKYPNGWWYPDPSGWRMKNGKPYSWTPGMAPRPFMANTLLDLEEEAKAEGGRIIAEYIGGGIA